MVLCVACCVLHVACCVLCVVWQLHTDCLSLRFQGGAEGGAMLLRRVDTGKRGNTTRRLFRHSTLFHETRFYTCDVTGETQRLKHRTHTNQQTIDLTFESMSSKRGQRNTQKRFSASEMIQTH